MYVVPYAASVWREVLTGVGAAFEWVGIWLVAAPELSPRLVRAWGRVRPAAMRVVWWVRRRLGWRGRVSKDLHVRSGIKVGGHASAVLSKGEGASLEEKVEFLLEQDREAQRRLNKVERAIAEQPEAWRQDIEETRGELEAFVREQVERERDVHIRIRLVGIVFLLAGVPLLAVANVA